MKKCHQDFKTNLEQHHMQFKILLDRYEKLKDYNWDKNFKAIQDRLKNPSSILNTVPLTPEILFYYKQNSVNIMNDINKVSNAHHVPQLKYII